MTSRRIAFNRLVNTRDLGGMRTRDGRTIRDGMLIRSAQLCYADAEDRSRLREMVGLVLDFRNGQEREQDPDPEVDGIVNLHLPIVDQLAPGVTREKNSSEEMTRVLAMAPKRSLEYMMALYDQFASNEFSRRQYSRFIDILLEDRDRAVLWHCSAGKDRAGFGSVIVERLLGVDEDSVMEDYLLTNEYLKDERERIVSEFGRKMGIRSDLVRESLTHLYSARSEYLNSLDCKIRELYGDFDTFALDGLGVTEEKRARLRAKFLV
ncbi:MAG: tyrosine-protein phosphatase [Spirochaetales bacterium]|nr:tyrosine-protein phosphatase [Spirochaetales bacterium]